MDKETKLDYKETKLDYKEAKLDEGHTSLFCWMCCVNNSKVQWIGF